MSQSKTQPADNHSAPEQNGALAEMSVIGSMLIDSRCVGAVMAALREDDFGDGPCRNTFRAIRALFLQDQAIDPITVQDKIGGGSAWNKWVMELMSITPTAANVELYAQIVRQNATLRQFRALCQQGLECFCLEQAEPLMRRIAALNAPQARGRTVSANDLAGNFLERMRDNAPPQYLPWGIPSAQGNVFAARGDFILLGGLASTGKTLLSVQMALAQARIFKTVYYTLETQPEKMADRIFSHLCRVNLGDIKHHAIPENKWTEVMQQLGAFVKETPICFVHASGFSVDDIAADAVSKRAEVIYIDYVQLVDGPGRDDYARVSAVSRGLKMFAQAHHIAVIGLAQLSRPTRVGKNGETKFLPPDMHSFRESGQLEQDADAAFLMWRMDENDNASPRVLKLGKNKEGKKFTTVLEFQGEFQTMKDLEMLPEEYAEVHKKLSFHAEMAQRGKDLVRMRRAAAAEEPGQVAFTEYKDDGDNPFL